MPLKAGIVGLPNVGKSTLFNAITNSHVEAANYPFATINPNTGVVTVPDERLDFLCDMFRPARRVNATFDFYDIAGLVKGASKGEGLGNQFLAAIRECDAICEVVRCFDSNEITHVESSVDPERDIGIIDLELAMADFESVTARIAKQGIKARVAHDKVAQYEMGILEPLEKWLGDGKPARSCPGLSDEQMEYARKNFFLLSSKPIIYVANVADSAYTDLDGCAYYQTVKRIAEREGAQCIPVSCEIEYEISQLQGDEKKEFLETLGVEESGLDKLVKAAYRLLNLSTFFTCGSDECRAWTFHNGMSAPECAGIIHTDFQKGFIKAEVYDFDCLKLYGSEAAVKEAGKLRQEGKDYRMKDGDVVFFRFNVSK
jgi:ribosome-binding ATPase